MDSKRKRRVLEYVGREVADDDDPWEDRPVGRSYLTEKNVVKLSKRTSEFLGGVS